MRSRSEGVASIGTRSLSWRFTPHAPTSASSATASTGGSGSRTTSPKGSRPRLPTVQRPNENLSSGRGAYRSVMGYPHLARRPAPHVAPRTAQRRIKPSVRVVPLVHQRHDVGPGHRRRAAADQSIARRVDRWPAFDAGRRPESPRRTPLPRLRSRYRPDVRRRRPGSDARAPIALRRRRGGRSRPARPSRRRSRTCRAG